MVTGLLILLGITLFLQGTFVGMLIIARKTLKGE